MLLAPMQCAPPGMGVVLSLLGNVVQTFINTTWNTCFKCVLLVKEGRTLEHASEELIRLK